ncbi:hypothetical protein [Streptomyces sp. NPDC051994]|uniref:hypothetical protein n=1 Tax=Streptomyces sp. NPDC051994 TaxID=3155287 RepID=UPI0034305074
MPDDRTVADMTDEELRASGISQEWRSGLTQQDWPYRDGAGNELAPQSPVPNAVIEQ